MPPSARSNEGSSKNSAVKVSAVQATVGPAERVKKIISDKSLPKVLFIASPDRVRPRRVAKMLVDNFYSSTKQTAVSTIRTEDLSKEQLRRLRQEASALSLFSSSTVVILELFTAPSASVSEDLAALVSSQLESKDSSLNLLVACSSSSISKKLRDLCSADDALIEFSELSGEELKRWVQKELRLQGVTSSDPGIVEHLLVIANDSPDTVVSLVEKLALYIDGSHVSTNDVQTLFPSEAHAEEFKLLDEMAAERTIKANAMLSVLMHSGKSPFMLLSLIARSFANYLKCRALADHGLTPDQVAQRLKMQPWLAKKHLQTAQRRTAQKLFADMFSITRADEALKGRSLDPANTLATLVSKLSSR